MCLCFKPTNRHCCVLLHTYSGLRRLTLPILTQAGLEPIYLHTSLLCFALFCFAEVSLLLLSSLSNLPPHLSILPLPLHWVGLYWSSPLSVLHWVGLYWSSPLSVLPLPLLWVGLYWSSPLSVLPLPLPWVGLYWSSPLLVLPLPLPWVGFHWSSPLSVLPLPLPWVGLHWSSPLLVLPLYWSSSLANLVPSLITLKTDGPHLHFPSKSRRAPL